MAITCGSDGHRYRKYLSSLAPAFYAVTRRALRNGEYQALTLPATKLSLCTGSRDGVPFLGVKYYAKRRRRCQGNGAKVVLARPSPHHFTFRAGSLENHDDAFFPSAPHYGQTGQTSLKVSQTHIILCHYTRMWDYFSLSSVLFACFFAFSSRFSSICRNFASAKRGTGTITMPPLLNN